MITQEQLLNTGFKPITVDSKGRTQYQILLPRETKDTYATYAVTGYFVKPGVFLAKFEYWVYINKKMRLRTCADVYTRITKLTSDVYLQRADFARKFDKTQA